MVYINSVASLWSKFLWNFCYTITWNYFYFNIVMEIKIICIIKKSMLIYVLRVRRAIAARLDLGEESPSSAGQGAG